jgi:anthraniloyl-CoA monooxygenase
MKILVAGAGPAGLSFAALMAESEQSHEILVLERSRSDQAPGFGVTVRDHALSFLGLGDRVPSQTLAGRALWYEGERVVDLPNPPQACLVTLSRASLIEALTAHCRDHHVVILFGEDTGTLSARDLDTYDLVVAADGANSTLRTRFADAFQSTTRPGRHRYAWLGADVPFSKLTVLLRKDALAWAYKYTPSQSTFIVECTEGGWKRLDFSKKSPEEAARTLAQVFSVELGGRAVAPPSGAAWCHFPMISSQRLCHRNMVLLGDAAHTTHFSQGFGTMFAFDDAMVLHAALRDCQSVSDALAEYERLQQPKIASFQATSFASMRWAESLLESAEAGRNSVVRDLIAQRWLDNAVTPSPMDPT